MRQIRSAPAAELIVCSTLYCTSVYVILSVIYCHSLYTLLRCIVLRTLKANTIIEWAKLPDRLLPRLQHSASWAVDCG